MNKGIILGLFGLLLLSSISFAMLPSPQQMWMWTMYDHASCGVDFTADEGGLLNQAWGYGTDMGYSPEQLAEFSDLAATLDNHDAQLFTYFMNNQYPQFLSELVTTNADIATAKSMYRTTMKQYVRADYSRIPSVVSDYNDEYSDYLVCVAHEVPE